MMQDKLSIQYPVIQAPMAGGIISPEFAAEVSNQGMLGSIAAGMLTPQQLAEEIAVVKKCTAMPFQVNIFAHPMPKVDSKVIEQTNQLLNAIRDTLNIPKVDSYQFNRVSIDAFVDICIVNQVPIVSFTFGCPTDAIKKLKAHHITVIGTATNVEEARALETAGVDYIVVQGEEAGGHQGGFMDKPSLPLFKLLPEVKKAVRVPLIAAGGLNDAQTIQRAFEQGADLIQVGTRFLNTEESSAHALHKAAINASDEKHTVVTRAFSGKYARGIDNRMIQIFAQQTVPPYPLMNEMTKDIRKAAKLQNNKEYMSNWSGQNIKNMHTLTLQQVIDELKHNVSNQIK